MFNLFLVLITLFGLENPSREGENVLKFTNSPSKADFSWQFVPLEGGVIPRIMVDPADSQEALALSFSQSWKTTDGTTWFKLRDRGFYDGDGVYTGPDTMLMFIHDTVYISPDGGITLTSIFQRQGGFNAMSHVRSDTVMLATTGVQDMLFITEDKGQSWDSLQISIDLDFIYAVEYAPGHDSLIYLAGESYYGDTTYVLKSNDRGLSWNVVYTMEEKEVTDIEINPSDPNEVFISTGMENSEGLIYTGDGFTTVYILPQVLMPYDVEYVSNDTILVASMFPVGVMMGVRYLGFWNFYRVDSLTPCADLENSGNIWYAGASTGILKSSDNGMTWQRNETGLNAVFGGETDPPLSRMVDRTLYCSDYWGNAIYKSDDGGQSWSKLYIPGIVVVFDIDVYPQNPDYLYLCAGGGEVIGSDIYLHNIYLSNDGAQTFVPVDTIPFTEVSEYAWKQVIHVSSSDSLTLLVAAYDDSLDQWVFMRSTDGGHTFVELGSSDEIYYDIVGTDTVFISADSTVYISYDMGLTYDTVAVLQSIKVNAMDYDPDNKLFYFADNYYLNSHYLRYHVVTGSLDTLKEGTYFDTYEINCGPNGAVYSGFYMSGGLDIFTRGDASDPFIDEDTLTFFPGALRSSSEEVLCVAVGGFMRSTDAVEVGEYRRDIPTIGFYWDINRNILCLNNFYRKITIEIYTVDGRKVFSREVYPGEKSISLEALQCGVYFVKMEGGTRGYQGLKKIVKIR